MLFHFLAALSAGDIIAIAAIIAGIFGTVIGVLLAQWLINRTQHKTAGTNTELTNQRILARLVRTLEGETDEDGFQRTKGFMQRTDDRLGNLEGWRDQVEAGKA